MEAQHWIWERQNPPPSRCREQKFLLGYVEVSCKGCDLRDFDRSWRSATFRLLRSGSDPSSACISQHEHLASLPLLQSISTTCHSS